jgi:mycothiol synthase
VRQQPWPSALRRSRRGVTAGSISRRSTGGTSPVGQRQAPAALRIGTCTFITNWPPREEWPEYTRVISELFNSIPFDDEEHGEIAITPAKLAELTRVMAATNGRVLSLVVREAEGRITGLTEMAMWEEQVGYAWQWLTAVHRSVQGNGIGRWLKAAMLIHIREHHPLVRWVLTGNAASNAPMLKINTELGFRTYRTTSGYQMPMADFAAAVGRRAGSR